MSAAYLQRLGPPHFRRRLADLATLLPDPNLKHLRWIVNTMDDTSKELFALRKAAFAKGDKAVLEQVGEGKDIMSILCKNNISIMD